MKSIAEFSERLSELIAGKSFSKVGDEIGLSKQTVSAYVHGVRNAKKPTIAAIATHYGVNPLWLMGYDVPQYKEKPTPVPESGPLDPLNARLNELLCQANPDTKKAMIALLEQLQTKG